MWYLQAGPVVGAQELGILVRQELYARNQRCDRKPVPGTAGDQAGWTETRTCGRGLCGSCNEWIALVSSKKKGTTWFRHAYKVSLTLYYGSLR